MEDSFQATQRQRTIIITMEQEETIEGLQVQRLVQGNVPDFMLDTVTNI